MTYMITVTRVKFDLLKPTPDDVRIVDIAHALSRIARWTGHTPGRTPYTVAQHCVLMARWIADTDCTKGAQICGLMHDAHEAYIGDISRPMKRFLGESKIKQLTDRIDKVIALAFDFTWGYPTTIRNYDDRMLEWEEWRIMKYRMRAPDAKPLSPDHLFDTVWEHEKANHEFTHAFYKLAT